MQAEHKTAERASQRIIADHHAELRKTNKTITNLQLDTEVTSKERMRAIADENLRIKQAVQKAREEERSHYAAKLAEKDKKLSAKELVITSLTNRAIRAEKLYEKTRVEANQSARRTKDLQTKVDDTTKLLRASIENERKVRDSLDILQQNMDRTSRELEEAVPIKSLSKTSDGKKGQPGWPLFVWETIIDQLVIGVPPMSVYRSVASVIKRYSPKVGINPISLTTVKRARTVLLVIVQTLAAYRLGKAGKFGQLFQDATSRRQDSFQNLVISIEEDELYR